MRLPMFAGSFYPKSEPSLRKTIEKCFLSERGPGELPSFSSKQQGSLVGVIAPHAGYQYSGAAAAWSYKAIAESQLPDIFIILAPNHNSSKSGICLETFQTPFGEVRVDQDFVKELVEKGTFEINNEIHVPEHSVEVQLPFLQFAAGPKADKLKIVPILVSSDIDLQKAAIDLKETLIDTRKKAVFIVSTDFTHYGRNYHYFPFYKDVKANLSELDGRAFELLKKGDFAGFDNFIQETEDTICGFYPLLLFLRAVKFKQANLEQYYVSGDLVDDYANSVSYASLIFK